MRIIQTRNYDEMSRVAAMFILNRIYENPQAVLGLATGHTPKGLYRALCLAQEEMKFPLSALAFFHLDEYFGLAPTHPESMGAFLQTHLFQPLGLAAEQIHFVPATHPDPELACQAYEAEIAACGGIDLQILGLGQNGHIAFNEPGTAFGKKMHLTPLSPETRAANAKYFAQGVTPETAMTLGLESIMQTREIVLLAAGQTKAKAIHDLLQGPLHESCPASILRFHPKITLILDREAANLLTPTPHFQSEKNLAIYALDHPLPLPPKASIWVAAPHPDDASIGCGGTLDRLRQAGHQLQFVSMTTGHRAQIPNTTREERIAIREAEALAEAEIFGGTLVSLALDFYEANYCPSSSDISKILALLCQTQPQLIFSASPLDRHPAHRMSALLLQEAIVQYIQQGYQPPELWFYEGPWFLFEREAFNSVVLLDQDNLAQKRLGVQAHASQIKRKRYDLAAEALACFRAITTPESRLSGFGADADFGNAIEVFERLTWQD